MCWFRSHSRLGVYLALFALAFQLALSFGHLHLEGFAAGRASVPAAAQALPSEQASATTAPDPAGHESPARTDDYCAVCALIHLAGSLSPAEAPSLPLPMSFGRLRLETAVEFDLTAPHRAPFRVRAPPIA